MSQNITTFIKVLHKEHQLLSLASMYLYAANMKGQHFLAFWQKWRASFYVSFIWGFFVLSGFACYTRNTFELSSYFYQLQIWTIVNHNYLNEYDFFSVSYKCLKTFLLDTVRKSKVHKTFRRPPDVFWTFYVCSIYILCRRSLDCSQVSLTLHQII